MIAAQVNAKDFVSWLGKYRHVGAQYANLGEALYAWLLQARGATALSSDYASFLQMVIAVLATSTGPLHVALEPSEGKYYDLPLPTRFDGWLPDKDDFQAAVQQNQRDDARHP